MTNWRNLIFGSYSADDIKRVWLDARREISQACAQTRACANAAEDETRSLWQRGRAHLAQHGFRKTTKEVVRHLFGAKGK